MEKAGHSAKTHWFASLGVHVSRRHATSETSDDDDVEDDDQRGNITRIRVCHEARFKSERARTTLRIPEHDRRLHRQDRATRATSIIGARKNQGRRQHDSRASLISNYAIVQQHRTLLYARVRARARLFQSRTNLPYAPPTFVYRASKPPPSREYSASRVY